MKANVDPYIQTANRKRYVCAKILVNQEKSTWNVIPLWADALRYRIPLPVTQVCVMVSGDSYAICPRCDRLLIESIWPIAIAAVSACLGDYCGLQGSCTHRG